jgi:hypothetical protein
MTVNHSENFIDPDTGARTQKVERMWRDLKYQKTISCGIRSTDSGGYAFEYIWRRNNLSNLSRAEKMLRLLATIRETDFT